MSGVLLESWRARIGRWAGAAAVVCALHVGAAAVAFMHWQVDETDDDAAGAPIVELAPLLAVARVDSPNVAHGPEQPEARLTPKASKEVAERKQKDIPRVEPSPAVDPEVALPKLQPDEKELPEQERAQRAVLEKQVPPQDDEVPLTTAPPRVDAHPAPSSLSSRGQAASLARKQAIWEKAVVRHLDRHQRYPPAAYRRGITGEVIVRFRIDRSGRVITSEITKSSGSAMLEEEGLALLKRASPLPAPPTGIDESALDRLFPIWFEK